jgi:hypothetical protein
VRIRDHEPARRARQHAANGRTQLEAGGEPSAGGDGPGEGSPASAPSAKAE